MYKRPFYGVSTGVKEFPDPSWCFRDRIHVEVKFMLRIHNENEKKTLRLLYYP